MKANNELRAKLAGSPARFSPSPVRQTASERRGVYYEGDLFDAESDVYYTSASKLSSKRSLYEMRFKSLEDTIRKISFRLNSDELLETMKQDPSSHDFASLRIKEIIEDCLHDEREALIESLTRRLSALRREMQVTEELYAQVRDRFFSAENNLLLY